MSKETGQQLFVINQRAGKGISQKTLSGLIKDFGTQNIVIPKSRRETELVVANFAKKNSESNRRGEVVVIGGDGTVNAVVNGLMSQAKPSSSQKNAVTGLTVGTFGTGSDYFKSLIAPHRFYNWRHMLASPRKTVVDLGKISYKDPAQSPRYFTNMASIGLPSKICQEKEKIPAWMPAYFKYLVPTLRALLSYKPHQLIIEADGVVYKSEVLALTISKGTYAGGGMRFGESVLLDDGFFEVTIFGKMHPTLLLFHMSKLYRGSIVGVPHITKIKAKKIQVSSPLEKLSVEFDGEVYGTTDVCFEVEPKTLAVHRPVLKGRDKELKNLFQ